MVIDFKACGVPSVGVYKDIDKLLLEDIISVPLNVPSNGPGHETKTIQGIVSAGPIEYSDLKNADVSDPV